MTTDHLFEQKIPDSPLSFHMVRVPGGTFRMGSTQKDDPEANESEMPQHPVRLDDCWIAECPVTQTLWEAVMGQNPAHFKGPLRPVETVSWFEAVVFCNALSVKTLRKPAYLTPNGLPFGRDGNTWKAQEAGDVKLDRLADGYCLPSEAEWEFAAKGGYDSCYQYSGSDLLDQVGWYHKNSDGETHDVGLLLPNALGLYDMSGNVWEWCNDWYDAYTEAAQENPPGPDKGVLRVVRGGGWGSSPQGCRSAFRNGGRSGYCDQVLGFRLALQSVG